MSLTPQNKFYNPGKHEQEEKNTHSIHASAPGKLMLAGEWSVREPGNSCITLPVNVYAHVTLVPLNQDSLAHITHTPQNTLNTHAPEDQESSPHKIKFLLHAPDIKLFNIIITGDCMKTPEGSHVTLTLPQKISSQETQKLLFITHTLTEVFQFLCDTRVTIKSCEITIDTHEFFFTSPDKISIKLGLGSSAAVCVALCKALLLFHEFSHETAHTQHKIHETISTSQENTQDPHTINTRTHSHHLNTPDILNTLIFNLAYRAHFKAQNNTGSGFDIATSVYQIPILYRSPEKNILELTNTQKKLRTNTHPCFTPTAQVTPFTLPKDLIILAGFTGTSASTIELSRAIDCFKKNNPEEYNLLCHAINTLVLELGDLLTSKQKTHTQNSHTPEIFTKIITHIKHNRELLKQLEEKSLVHLETPLLIKLIQCAEAHGGVGKFSGAGGGDCGIAICDNQSSAQKILTCWQQNSIIPLIPTFTKFLN